MFDFPEEEFPGRQMYVRLESITAVSSFPPYRRCVRLFGVSPASFGSQAFNNREGSEIFVIEVPRLHSQDLVRATKSSYFSGNVRFWTIVRNLIRLERMDLSSFTQKWVELEYTLIPMPAVDSEDAANVALGYTAFRNSPLNWLRLSSARIIEGPRVMSPQREPSPTFTTALKRLGRAPFDLKAFHVGQGMCSLFSNGRAGVLFDAGAAKPVYRDDYKRHATRNDLRQAIRRLPPQRLILCVSHDDYDHYCLWEWDAQLRRSIKQVLVPRGVRSLIYRSKVVISSVFEVEEMNLDFGRRNRVALHRTRPTKNRDSSNNKALVATAQIDHEVALLPGDYLYTAMAVDKNDHIRGLARRKYKAIMVPHHGESGAGIAVPCPSRKGKAIAFFSAGTNRKYLHPRTTAVRAHKTKGYLTVSKHRLRFIKGVRLL